MQDVTLNSMPLTLLSLLFYLPLLHLSCSIASPCLFIQHSLAASLMSVLSCGPPFHTAAFTIMSITSNYLAVFPLLTLSPAFILVLELYAFQMGATAFPLPPYPVRDGKEEDDGREQVKTNLVCHRLWDCETWLGWPASLCTGPDQHLRCNYFVSLRTLSPIDFALVPFHTTPLFRII